MRDTFAHILSAALFAAFLFCGCARQLGVLAASHLAVTRSNQEAERLYHFKPFKEEDGQWRQEGRHRVWEALTSFQGHDMVARVIFDERGKVFDLDVEMLAQPTIEPVNDPELRIGPEMQRENTTEIPEVMPE